MHSRLPRRDCDIKSSVKCFSWWPLKAAGLAQHPIWLLILQYVFLCAAIFGPLLRIH